VPGQLEIVDATDCVVKGDGRGETMCRRSMELGEHPRRLATNTEEGAHKQMLSGILGMAAGVSKAKG
jgi:hypothetical protein